MDRKEVSGGLEEVRKALEYFIGNEKRFNYHVIKPDPADLLRPEVDLRLIMPLGHSEGLYMYYRRIETVLMKAQRNGSSLENIESAPFS